MWRAPDYQVQIVGDGAAYALNDDELAVGSVATDVSAPWADCTAQMRDLRTRSAHPLPGLDGAPPRTAPRYDIDDEGVLVGSIETPAGARAVVWGPYQPER